MMERIWFEPHPLNRGNERITQNVAGLMCDEKANTRIGIIYTRINIRRHIIIFPYLVLFDTL